MRIVPDDNWLVFWLLDIWWDGELILELDIQIGIFEFDFLLYFLVFDD
jgi:hypothetical protein